MYQKPSVARLGTFRQLTQLGCNGATDSYSIPGIGTSIGNVPSFGSNGQPTVCFAPNVSR